MIQWVKMFKEKLLDVNQHFGKCNLQFHVVPISVNQSFWKASLVPHCKRKCDIIVVSTAFGCHCSVVYHRITILSPDYENFPPTVETLCAGLENFCFVSKILEGS